VNVYRRNDFKSWFADVDFLYVIVTVLVMLCFAGLGLKAQLSTRISPYAATQTEFAAAMASEYGQKSGRM